MLCLVSPAEVVPRNHPLRAIKALADEALSSLDDIFEAMYARGGRPSVPPERLLKSMVLMALYSVRSDLQLCEQIQYNLLFRWFLDMDMTEDSWDATTFSKNRERLMEHEVAPAFFGAVIEQARARRLMSAEHFSVDRTLIEAWASLKSFRRPDEEQDDGPSSVLKKCFARTSFSVVLDFASASRGNAEYFRARGDGGRRRERGRWTCE